MGEYFLFWAHKLLSFWEKTEENASWHIGQIGACLGLHVLGLGLGDFLDLGFGIVGERVIGLCEEFKGGLMS